MYFEVVIHFKGIKTLLKVLLVSNFNMFIGVFWAYMLKPILIQRSHDPRYVPETAHFYAYMLVAILSHDFLFYHGHRYISSFI